MKNTEFHVPFIKSLVIVALVTVVSIVITDYFLSSRFFPSNKTPVFTSSQSQISPESPQ